MIKIRNRHILNIEMYMPGNDFKWVEYIPEFNENFNEMKAMTTKVMNGIFLNLMFNIPRIYITFTMIYLFCLKE